LLSSFLLAQIAKLSQTAEHLTPTSLNRQPTKDVEPAFVGTSRAVQAQDNPVKGDRSKSTFMEDGEVPVQFRALLKDCKSTMLSGYEILERIDH
jgi:hypothetical protein